GRPSKNHASSSALPLEVREPISEVTITPKKISAQREEKISYSFFSRSPYTSATAEFFSFKPNAKGEIVPTRVYTDKFKSIKANKKTDARQWDGKNWKGQFSFGEHQLQIRAWRGPGSSGEWFGPYYGPRVRVLK
ncbi:MAG TPA: hypothetical protein VFS77_22115, partial [Pyrinomonadaceae bacterium]|nr:hypothetical protein [Pyrinomonadaceae bacterium]